MKSNKACFFKSFACVVYLSESYDPPLELRPRLETSGEVKGDSDGFTGVNIFFKVPESKWQLFP